MTVACSPNLIPETTVTGGAAAPTTAATTLRIVGVIVVVSFRPDGNWSALNLGASLFLLRWEHAITFGEILTDCVRPHGGVFHG